MGPQIEKRERISKGKGVLLLAIAFLFDLVQGLLNLIPFVGWIASSFLGILGILLFYLWFKVLGVKFSDSMNKFLTSTAVNLITIIPILGALPERFIGTLLIIRAVRKEDALYNAEQEKERMKMEQQEALVVGARNNQALAEQEEEKRDTVLLFQRTKALEKSRETSYKQSEGEEEQKIRTLQTLQSIGVGVPQKTSEESLRRLAPRKTSTESGEEIEERPLARYTIEKPRGEGSVPEEFRLRKVSAIDVARENQAKRNLLKKQRGAFAQGGGQIPTGENSRGVTILDKLRKAEAA